MKMTLKGFGQLALGWWKREQTYPGLRVGGRQEIELRDPSSELCAPFSASPLCFPFAKTHLFAHPGSYDFSLPQQSVPDSGPRPPAAPAPFPPGPPMMPPPFVSFMSFPGLGFSSLHPQLLSPSHCYTVLVEKKPLLPLEEGWFCWSIGMGDAAVQLFVHKLTVPLCLFVFGTHWGWDGSGREKIPLKVGWGCLSLSLFLIYIL